MTVAAGDQTRGDSTPFIAEPEPVAMSRGEVAALCMKAARGAGMAWGLAEEAGFAAAWLAGRGIDGPGHLLAHLMAAQGRAWADLCPAVAKGRWTALPERALCPIALGATLCDHAALPEGPGIGCELWIGPVDHPVFLLPFLVVIAQEAHVTFRLAWEGGEMSTDASAAALDTAARALGGRTSMDLRLACHAGGVPAADAMTPLPAVAGDTIGALNELAMRTTVPASAASRAGAGAGTTDND